MGEVREIHVTEVPLFRLCRLRWHYQYREVLVPREEDTGPLWFGTGVHYALAQAYSNRVHPRDALLDWEGYRGSSVPLLEEVLEHYAEHYRDDFNHWEVLGVETPVRSRLRRGLYLVGTFDLLVKEASGHIWVVDHKTRTYFDSPDDLEIEEQVTGYLYLASREGIPARGMIWNEIRKASPRSNPRVTEFFRRTKLFRSPIEIRGYYEDLLSTAAEMFSKYTAIYPNPGIHCGQQRCPYRILCRARRQGSDVSELKSTLYTIGA
jgi:hypothetical protein